MASAGIFSLPSIQANRVGFIGPTAFSTFVQALQTGAILASSTHFWIRAGEERVGVKVVVGFVTVVSLVQTSVTAYKWWNLSVLHFGDWVASASITWPDVIQPVLTLLMAAPIQSYYIWRCWRICNQNPYLLALLLAILLAYSATTLAVFGTLIQFDFSAVLQPDAPAAEKQPVVPVYVASLVLPARECARLLDAILTVTLLSVLVRSRAVGYTKRFRRMMSRLIFTAWETAIPPAACAIVTVVVYCLTANSNYWDLALQAIVGKLYVLSFLVTLNNRAEISREAYNMHTHFPTMTRQIEGVGWRVSSELDSQAREIRVSIARATAATATATQHDSDIEMFGSVAHARLDYRPAGTGEGESADSEGK
ncbi:hypothetical protein OF83DRAFT_945799 [Amylostereum chailletii]|nr:hypothetical protein OF83DRAFT_945799 [Amylostereum chailletii]